jgi:Ca2+-binding EF-hand superfamily protein
MSNDEIDENKKVFFKLDKNNDGYITMKELKDALKDKYDEN